MKDIASTQLRDSAAGGAVAVNDKLPLVPEENTMSTTVKEISPLWNKITRVDQAILSFVRSWEQRWVTRFMTSVTHLGDASSWVCISFLLLAMGEPGRIAFKLVAVSALGASLVAQGVKYLFRRPRPEFSPHENSMLMNSDQYSFPSGHTTAAFAVCVALIGQGSFLGPMAFVLATLIGTSRVYLGAHYPLDVGAGAGIGMVVGVLVRFLIL